MRAGWAGAAICGVLIHCGTAAGAFEIDFAALITAHEAEVTQAQPGIRVLEMPGPVIVSEITQTDGTRRYLGVDHSGLGAVGCNFRVLIDMVMAAGMCPGTLTTQESAVLDRHLERTALFVGRNTVPPVHEAEIRPMLLDRLRKLTEQYEHGGGVQCPDPQSGAQDWAEMARNLARPGGQAAVERALGLPRLPVVNPCL